MKFKVKLTHYDTLSMNRKKMCKILHAKDSMSCMDQDQNRGINFNELNSLFFSNKIHKNVQRTTRS